MTSYYGMKAELTNDIERFLKTLIGKEFNYDDFLHEVLRKYGFSEKIVSNMLEPYKKADQIFIEKDGENRVCIVAPEWKMSEKRDIFSIFEG